jgi:two-component system nitrogen regulation sensor histidine kinase NtrY
VEELKNLVNEFSAFARIPAIRPRPNDLNRIAREAVALFREAHRGIEFELKEDPSLPLFDIDRDQMKRAFINILDNAVESTNGKGKVELEIIYDGELKSDGSRGTARIEIKDNGRGIREEDRERIFEPYYSTKSHGSGLGLPIVQRIINDHYGHIRVSSNSPKGTRFIIELPVGMSYNRGLEESPEKEETTQSKGT